MKHFLVLLFLSLWAAVTVFAQKPVELTEVGKDRFEASFLSGGELRVHLRSGEIRVTGTEGNTIRVHYEGKAADKIDDVRVSLKTWNNTGELHVSGGPRNTFRIVVEVPKNLDLYLRVPAGEVEVEGVTGNKDVELHAGELTVAIGSPSDYARVDASVSTGELDADPFDVSKGGLFRSFKTRGHGKYRLHAHVGAGQLTLR